MPQKSFNQRRLHELKLAVTTAATLGGAGPSSRTDLTGIKESPAACFLGATGVYARNITPDRASATVFIVDTHENELGRQDYSTGTGFIVQNSAGAEGVNRIVSAQHVTNDYDGKDGKDPLLIYNSLGVEIGKAERVASGGFNVPDGGLTPTGKFIDDWVVLKITSFASDAARQTYKAYRGLPLAPLQATDPAIFYTSDHTATFGLGSSGGPVFNAAGAVVGRITGKRDDIALRATLPGVDRVMTYGSTEEAARANRPLNWTTIKEKPQSGARGIGFIAPMNNPNMLAALNKGGAGVTSSRLTLKETVTVTAFPDGNCAIYQGEIETFLPQDKPATTSKQDQKPVAPRPANPKP